MSFSVKILGMKERQLPDWEELPTLEEFEGSLDELREKTRSELEITAQTNAERSALDKYIEQLLSQSEIDLPDVMVEREADNLLKEREAEFTRYGIKPEQLYEYQGRQREDYVKDMMPEAEERLRTTLALQEIVKREGLSVGEAEVDAEIEEMLKIYPEEQRDNIRGTLATQLRSVMERTALDKKLRQYLLTIAQGEQPSSPGSEVGLDVQQTDSTADTEQAQSSASDTSENDA